MAKSEAYMHTGGVEIVWLQIYVPAGANIYQAVREMSRRANTMKMHLFADLNGTIAWVMPDDTEESALAKFETEFNKRVKS